MADVMLTTIDNPYNPFTEWNEWLQFDLAMGYDTSGYLARVTITSDELSESDQDWAIEDAIDEIIQMNPDGFYKKVTDE